MQILRGDLGHGQVLARTLITQARAENPGYRVIDLGGTAGGWSQDLVTVTLDICAPASADNIRADLCREPDWQILLDQVSVRGPYDFAICTHTLEDIYNPITALELLPKIARAGIITMPTARTELSHVEHPGWLGYIHHRWIFDQQHDHMLLVPKLTVLEHLVGNRFDPPSPQEICYIWQDTIPYQIFMDNYLGPNVGFVVHNYQDFITRI